MTYQGSNQSSKKQISLLTSYGWAHYKAPSIIQGQRSITMYNNIMVSIQGLATHKPQHIHHMSGPSVLVQPTS